MNRRLVLKLGASLAAIGGLGYGARKLIQAREASHCNACRRTIHDHMRTVAEVNGHEESYCCPACALSEHRQSGRPVNVVSLSDTATGKPLRAESAYLVRGSDVNMCQHHEPALGQGGQPLAAHFDRCSPSVLAFATRRAADAFRAEHGGEVFRFTEFASAFRS